MELPISINYGAQKELSSKPSGLVNFEQGEYKDHSGKKDQVCQSSDEDESFLPEPTDVFFPESASAPIPSEFNAVRIPLDGKVRADLSWGKELLLARDYVRQKKKLFWDLDLGLFNQLDHPLDHKAQFLSLCLTLEHFKNTIWKEFQGTTVGLCLYRGDIDFSIGYRWNEAQATNLKDWCIDRGINPEELQGDERSYFLKLLCQDSCSEYLKLLAILPDTVPLYLLLDAHAIQDPYELGNATSKEGFSNFHIALKGSSVLHSEFVWDNKSLRVSSKQETTLGVCHSFSITSNSCFKNDLRRVIENLGKLKKTFRLIPLLNLTNEWDGLDDLIVDSDLVDKQFLRKLQGFCAAGGRVVFAGKPLHLPNEVSLYEWENT